MKLFFLGFILSFASAAVSAQSTKTLAPLADAYVRNGTYASTNYGSDTSLVLKGSNSSGYTRLSYLKFSLSGLNNISSAKLRIYGRNIDNASTISISSYGIDNDLWTQSGINFNNAPTATSAALSSASVNNIGQYYEFNVSNFVINQAAGDQVVSFLIKDPTNQNTNLFFNSKENANNPPQLVISTGSASISSPSNALLFIENLDRFPANDYFVASRIQIPWSRDTVNYNANHDSLTIRIHNNGINPLIVNNLALSSTSHWKIEKLKGVTYVPSTGLPISISSGAYADVTVRFIAVDQATRVKVLHDTLTISSNDDKFPAKVVYLNGVWQKQGEGSNEPYLQEVLDAFGYKTSIGFGHTDPDLGDSTKLKGNEIRPSYFVRADTSRPIYVRQINAYHGCCTQSEKIQWYTMGSSTLNTIFTHTGKDAQSVLPRKNSSTSPTEATFSTSNPFGFQVGYTATTDAKKNFQGKIGIRVYKALDEKGNIIPNSYIISNDYLGTKYTNYDYQDNTYFIKNVRPVKGSAFFSTLKSTPSALDFGEKILQTTNSLQLNLSSLGQNYSDGSGDPVITVSSIAIAGENKSEFAFSMPAITSLNPQQSTTLTVNFNPASQGLKIADLLIYYNNSQSPLRVPLYGIAKASGTTVTANYRVNSGSSTSITLNGKTWSADNQYSFDNLQPFTNTNLHQIACTDEDTLYLKEQSSNADKKPFRYEFPITNGDYVVRLHFAEIYQGAPGAGINGGAGSRVMNISIENQLRLANFDVTQEVGGATAIIRNFPVTVTDGKLNIDFSANVNRPMVCAVEIYSFSTTAAKPVSKIVENRLEKAKIYPNPIQKALNIQFPVKYAGDYNLQIVDALGNVYEIGEMKLPKGGSNMEVDISRFSLKPGFYYLRILSQKTKPELIKLVVD